MATVVDLCVRRICLLAVVLLLFSECMSDESLDLESSSQARAKRQIIDCRNKPEALRFRCGSGGCVDIDRVCDGREDCLDASDETIETCSNNAPCPGLSFRCSYGACIDADLRCDGKRDCADGSDEHPRVCNPGHNKGNKGNKNPNKGQGNNQGNVGFGNQDQGNLGFANQGQGNQNFGSQGQGNNQGFGGQGQGNLGFESQGNNQGLGNPVRPGLGLSNEQTSNGGCRTSEYRCTDGQCIDTTLVCDGNEDCRDKSDETYTQCYSVKCPSYSFRCAYGGCIDREGRCDGRRQCADGSDEDEAMCRGQASQTAGQGQTGTGGSTGGQGQWTTQKPATRPTQRPRPTTNAQRPQTSQTPRPQVQSGSGCRLPQHETGSSYVVNGCQRGDNSALCRGTPGTLAPESSSLTYTCHSGHSLVTENVNFTFCLNGKWNPEPPKCAKTCPSLISNSVDLECTLDGKEVRCDKGQLPRTRATLKCKPSYRFPAGVTPDYNAVNCQQDGTWDWPLFKCIPDIRAVLLLYTPDFKIGAKPVRIIPIDLFVEAERLADKWNDVPGRPGTVVCGVAIGKGQTLIVNGDNAAIGDFPWHAGIYDTQQKSGTTQVCGGSLVLPNLVVSAAHCFYDDIRETQVDPSRYKVAVGKYYRDWDATEQGVVQRSDVVKVYLPSRYRGKSRNYADDISLVQLSVHVSISAVVMPICVDWLGETLPALRRGDVGTVVGWGRTGDRTPSPTLQSARLPFVPFDDCLKGIPETFRPFITSDKFCAGNINGSAVAKGDSGGGLAFKDKTAWFLRGVVSAGVPNSLTYSAFTNINSFREWMSQIRSQVESHHQQSLQHG